MAETEEEHIIVSQNPLIQELIDLRQTESTPKELWPRLLKLLSGISNANRSLMVIRQEGADQNWKKICDWAEPQPSSQEHALFNSQLDSVLKQIAKSDRLLAPLVKNRDDCFVLGIRLNVPGTKQMCAAIFLLVDHPRSFAREALMRLELIGDVPEFYAVNQALRKAKSDVERFAGILDLVVQVNVESHFLASSLAYCNGLATRFQCERVSVGWLEKGYVQLRAVSRTENFNRKMSSAQALEKAMEECLDQGEEILWPAEESGGPIARDHGQYAQSQVINNIVSLPLRVGDDVVAVVTLEREAKEFSDEDQESLRLSCDLCSKRLMEQHQADRWWGARMLSSASDRLSMILGPEHTGTKIVSLILVTALAFLLFGKMDYRVEAPCLLRSDTILYLTTPFDGYIEEVKVRNGDQVTVNQELLRLDTSELLLQETSAVADQSRYLREAERARADGSLADMRVAEAMAAQAEARLGAIQFNIAQASIESPYDGVIIEGNLRERIGTPVTKGENLFKISKGSDLYLEAEVSERDVHHLIESTTGELAFTAKPKQKFPLQVVRIEPAAISKDGENMFIVRCALTGEMEDWFRPGMSGVCKLEAGRRSLLWVFTHRTIDFLRLRLWM